MAEHQGTFNDDDRSRPRPRQLYESRMADLRAGFAASLETPTAGRIAVKARSEAVDALIRQSWAEVLATEPAFAAGVAAVAVGGYGRSELFLHSDVDLLFLLDPKLPEKSVKDAIRRTNQLLWDSGLRVSPVTRTLAECERFDPENVEFTLALLDARALTGDSALAGRLLDKTIPRLLARDARKIANRLLEVARIRHARYGNTLFHLEPNIKECPGGLRDAHVTAWLGRLQEAAAAVPAVAPSDEFTEAFEFLLLIRTFLHLRHGRDDNTLDWESQDAAAAAPLGASGRAVDAAYWMQLYFRQARSIDRGVRQAMEDAAPAKSPGLLAVLRGAGAEPDQPGLAIRSGRIHFTALDAAGEADPARDPDIALGVFAAMAATGASLSRESSHRLEAALPLLSANLEDGPGLWSHLESILLGPHAGQALRAMHALGILELLIPEFHAVDALVIRDAYHRYTVDEHTFVVVDTLHALGRQTEGKRGASGVTQSLGDQNRSANFAGLLRELPHPSLLYLAALLHDTGKGHAVSGHAEESVRMARNLLDRLSFDAFESTLVLDLIRNHLEMSAALRRDVFDSETIRAFATRVGTPEALRMLTVFTYADISAVHPDALTPWKAENLWNLYIATANFMDRHVDDERVGADAQLEDLVQFMQQGAPWQQHLALKAGTLRFLEGFPRRYLQTRAPEQIRRHIELAALLQTGSQTGDEAASIQLDFRFSPTASDLSLVTRDRPMLFAAMAGALSAWGMNIVTADAFSNADGLVVDSFRFTDPYRTLELNESERTRFLASIHDVVAGKLPLETLLAGRRRAPRPAPKVRVETRLDIDANASSQSTLVQVVAQDNPGLLRALALAIAEQGCNIEVALVDTEGEMAIDVFYITHNGAKLEPQQLEAVRTVLLEAIATNER